MRRRLPLIEDAFDRRQVLLLGAAATVAACGGTVTDGLLDGDGAVADDTGDPGVEDAGSPVADAGRRPTDSGVFSRDAVTPNPDAGVPTHDAGSPVVDAGGPAIDAGPPHTDAGTPPTDTGRRDAGPADTGPVDSGVACPTTGGIGAVTGFAVGAFHSVTVSGRRLLVGRDAGGLYAFSALCTHQGCTLPVPVRGVITCPCHRATFDANGQVTGGPARTSLAHYQVTVCAGQVYVGTATVAAATRTPA